MQICDFLVRDRIEVIAFNATLISLQVAKIEGMIISLKQFEATEVTCNSQFTYIKAHLLRVNSK